MYIPPTLVKWIFYYLILSLQAQPLQMIQLEVTVVLFFFFFFLSFCLFRVTPIAYGGSQARGSNQSCCYRPTPQPQQRQIWAASVTYTTAHGNARSSTHWVRPGMEPATSRFLFRFVSTAPRWELWGHCHSWSKEIKKIWIVFGQLYLIYRMQQKQWDSLWYRPSSKTKKNLKQPNLPPKSMRKRTKKI